jgi:hypothetical protein
LSSTISIYEIELGIGTLAGELGCRLCLSPLLPTILSSRTVGMASSIAGRQRSTPSNFIFMNRGHGFGMYSKETTSTGWFEAFVRWIGMHGMLKPVVSGTGGVAN